MNASSAFVAVADFSIAVGQVVGGLVGISDKIRRNNTPKQHQSVYPKTLDCQYAIGVMRRRHLLRSTVATGTSNVKRTQPGNEP